MEQAAALLATGTERARYPRAMDEAEVDGQLTGGCMCGAVRFALSARPVSAGYCHCSRCRRRTGTAASLNAVLAPGSFRFLRGEDLVRCHRPDDGYDKAFCGACGSGLFSKPPNVTEPAAVRMGAFDGDPGVRPSYRQFVAYAAEWDTIPDDGLPRHPERRPG